MAKPDDHDSYIASAPEAFREMLTGVRNVLSDALPEAREVMMYGMPGFEVRGDVVAGYAAFSKQCGLYVDPASITDLAEEIAAAKLKSTRTGVTFSPAKPVPDALIRQLAIASLAAKKA